ncbi:MAG TPA: hypothetical protein VI796_04050 [Candidatus Thermoplasmatota archaeon]|nr:hypothetical protein [Candidatus Thermoplasmatota archaeon]
MEPFARAVHAVHGTRGLGLSAALLLVFAILEPGFPPTFPRAAVMAPCFALLATGLLTLPREGVAAQDRALALLDHPRPLRPMTWRLVWLLLAVGLLLPRLFLAAYGIPHLSPLTGLLLPDWQRRIALIFLFVAMLVPILYLRSSRLYAPTIRVRRPVEIDRVEGFMDRRDMLMILTYALLGVWILLLRPFWQPFSLLEWPVSFHSFTQGTRGVAAFGFAITLPMVMFMSLVAHLTLLRRLRKAQGWPHRPQVQAMAILHVALILLVVFLHAYDLLWIVRYNSLSGF